MLKKTSALKALLILLFPVIFLSSAFSQTDSTKVLLLGPEFSKYLNLDKDQLVKITPLRDSIQAILKIENDRREEIRAKMQSGERPGREEFMEMRDKRQKDIETIKGLIEDIKKVLNPEQLEKFKNVELPNLEMRRRRMRPNN